MNPKREGYKKASSDVVQLTGSGLSLFDNCVHFSSTCPFSPQVLPLLGSAGARQGQVTLSSSTALLLHVLSCGKYMEFFLNKMVNASSVSISVAGTSPQSQDAAGGGEELPPSTGAMMAAHGCHVGHCSAVGPDAATSPGVWGGCGGYQEGCTAHCWLPP